MIIAEINKKKVHIPTEWRDLTIGQAIELSKLDLPEGIEDAFDWFRHIDTVKRGYLAATDIDPDMINPAELVHYWGKHLARMAYDLQSSQPETFTPKMIETFTHQGVTYTMPRSLDLGVNVILMHNTKVKPFIEASNLLKQFSELKQNGLSTLPMLIASVVTTEGDTEWNEEAVVERGKAFESLTMDVGWEVFFCLSLLIIKFGSTTLESLSRQRVTRLQKLINAMDSKLGRLQSRKAALQAQLTALMR